MTRTLMARREIFGEPKRFRDALIHHAPELLQLAAGDEVTKPDGDGSFRMTLTVHAAGAKVRKAVRVHLGEARESGPWVRIPIQWEADPASQLFPSFDGGLELEDHDASRAEVALVGTYRPPLGPIGSVADTMLFSHQITDSLVTLLNNLGRQLVRDVYGEGAPLQASAIRAAMTVRDVMTEDVMTMPEDLSLRVAAQRLRLIRASGAPVVDDNGMVVGVISERDLLDKVADERLGLGSAAYAAWQRYTATTVGQACSRPAETTDADTSVRDAASRMAKLDLDRLVVLDGAAVVGLVTRSDVLSALIRSDDDIDEAVRAVLADLGEAQVRSDVTDGMVTLSGTTTARSKVGVVLRSLERCDGVLFVNGDGLGWDVDDVVPIPPPML